MKKIIFSFLCVFTFMVSVNAGDPTLEAMQKITDNGTITIKSVKPTTGKDLQWIIDTIIQEKLYLNGEDYWVWFSCNDDLDTIKNEDGSYTCETIYLNNNEHMSLKIYIDDSEVNEEIKDKVDDLINEINKKTYYLDDFGLLNLIVNRKKVDRYTWQTYTERGIKYSNDLIKTIGNENFDFRLSNHDGDGDPYWIYAGGPLSIMYNGTIYGYTPDYVMMNVIQLLYVPSTTDNTSEAYMEAIKKRIKEYFGDSITFNIEEYRPISEILDRDIDYDNDPEYSFIDSNVFNTYYNGYNNKLDMVYKITINGEEYYFMIEKNDERIVKPKYEMTDPTSNVEVSSESSEVPLDSILDVEHIDEDSDEYEEIKENVHGDFDAYDFNLFSQIKCGYIKILTNGYLRIGIPLSNKFFGKTIYVYYYNESRVLIKHKTVIIDNVAYFETNHLSTFVLAEEQKEEPTETQEEKEETKTSRNPQTGDNIYLFVIMSIISLIALVMNKQLIRDR